MRNRGGTYWYHTHAHKLTARPAKFPVSLSLIKVIPENGAIKRNVDLSLQGMRLFINGLQFQMDQIAFDVKRSSVEIWSIRNPAKGMPRPMPGHGFSFQVIERLNSPHQVSGVARFVRIAIDFTHDFPGNQTCVFHCHNLEHEDRRMMIIYRMLT